MEHAGIASPRTIHAPFRARDDAPGAIPQGLLGWSLDGRPDKGSGGRFGRRIPGDSLEGSRRPPKRSGAPALGAPLVPSLCALKGEGVLVLNHRSRRDSRLNPNSPGSTAPRSSALEGSGTEISWFSASLTIFRQLIVPVKPPGLEWLHAML